MGDEILKKLPEGWKECKLIDIIELHYGKGLIEQDRKNGNIPVYGSNGIVGYHNEYLVKGPGIIIGRKGSVGEIKYSPLDFFPIDTTYYVSPKKEIDIKYMYYFLLTLCLDEMNSHSAVPGLNRSNVHSLNIIIPPLPEQRKIADILETADEAIEKTDVIIEKYRRIQQGLMQDLLTKGIDEKGQIRNEDTHKFKDSPLGRIPEEWEVVRLQEAVIRSFSGGTPNRENPEFFNGTIKWLKSGEISTKYIYNTEEKITLKGFKLSGSKYITKDSVVIALYGATAGQTGIVKEKMTMNQAVLALACNKTKTHYEYLYYHLRFRVPKILAQLQGSGQPNLNKEIVDNSLIPLPPLLEQHRIASILSQIDEVIEKEERYKEKLERIKQGLMQDLLTGKVRVNHLIEEF